MQNNRKTISFILIFLGLAIIAAILYLLFMKKAPVSEVPAGTVTPSGQITVVDEIGTTTPSDQPRRTVYDISKETAHAINADDLAKRAAAHAERFGSYSTQSGYSNFTDLKMYMTPSLQTWADKFVAEQEAAAKTDAYYGITTNALTTEIKSFDDKAGTAQITVMTERRESTETIGGGSPFKQTLDISFLRINDEWLMDKAYWSKK